MLDELIKSLSAIEPHIRVLILAALPVSELRGAIPLGVAWGLAPFSAFIWAVIGNFLPIIPLLLLLPKFFRRIMAVPFFNKILGGVNERAYMHAQKMNSSKYQLLALMLFVAIPLPLTGAWTGCLVAVLLRLRFVPSLAAITMGELIAGILVSLVTTGVVSVYQEIGWLLLLIIIAAVALIYIWRKKH